GRLREGRKSRKPKRPREEVRAEVASELLDLQVKIIRMTLPGALVGLRETNFLASVAMCAILNTIPGKTPNEKEKNTITHMDIHPRRQRWDRGRHAGGAG
ncbi:hypothetical protein, partial [Mesorhizobium sp.]|uniref:hypothetical protein n=1 Tax=Mesorhizobium sp. TaxID=1871066 RepID=UPI0025D01E54